VPRLLLEPGARGADRAARPRLGRDHAAAGVGARDLRAQRVADRRALPRERGAGARLAVARAAVGGRGGGVRRGEAERHLPPRRQGQVRGDVIRVEVH